MASLFLVLSGPGFLSRLGQFCGLFHALLETLNTTLRVQDLLFSGIKRVATGANTDFYCLHGGAALPGRTTGARELRVWIIGWVDISFHDPQSIARNRTACPATVLDELL